MENKAISSLIASASKQLGMSPEALRKALGSGDIASLTASLSPSDKAKLSSALKNTALKESIRRKYGGS